jgi:hypothetical protein
MATPDLQADSACARLAPPTQAFDPADWLSRFTAAGGSYTITEELMSVGWPLRGKSIEQQQETRRILSEIEGNTNDDRREALRTFVLTQTRRF